MTLAARSVHGGMIRLSDERWAHIVEGHGEMAGLRDRILETVAHPQRVLAGGNDSRLAVSVMNDGKRLVVVYREEQWQGFVITAFLTRRERSLNRRPQLWPLA